MRKKDAIVVGGGLAGLSAAVQLVEKGKDVVVLEYMPHLGGRTANWNEKGMEVESGLHRYIGYYTALPTLLGKAGIDLDKIIQWEDEIEIRIADTALQADFGLSVYNLVGTISGIVGNNNFLTPVEKIRYGIFLTQGLKDYVLNPKMLDTLSIKAYARNHSLSDKIIQRIIEPLSTGIFFLPTDKYSAFVFFGFIVPAFYRFYQMRIGAFKGGMTDVMIDPIAAYIEKRGGKVRRNSKVEQLLVKNNKVYGVQLKNEKIEASEIIIAASLNPAKDLIRASFKDVKPFKKLLDLPSMPAITVQIELTKPALERDLTTFAPGTHLCSFAEQSRTTFKNTKGRLSIILTPAEKFLKMKEKEILKVVIAEAKRLGIHFERDIKDFRVIAEPVDFYSLTAETEKMRPEQATHVSGLTLAGDYTKQQFFCTMEGAVVSGQKAAEIVLGQLSNE